MYFTGTRISMIDIDAAAISHTIQYVTRTWTESNHASCYSVLRSLQGIAIMLASDFNSLEVSNHRNLGLDPWNNAMALHRYRHCWLLLRLLLIIHLRMILCIVIYNTSNLRIYLKRRTLWFVRNCYLTRKWKNPNVSTFSCDTW